jgi:hypothetical protein
MSRISSSGKSLEKFSRKKRIEVTAARQPHSSSKRILISPGSKGASMRRYPMIVRAIAVAAVVLARAPICRAQGQPTPDDSGTSTDLFIMLGPDVDRPGLAAKANYNVGIGHTFGFLQHDLIGDEVTVAYTYENAGDGFWHSDLASSTESVGLMKNFELFSAKRLTWYTWIQVGLTSFTGGSTVQNHLYNGESLGAILHVNTKGSIWIQETYNKVVTVPWYTTTSVGYTWSW